MRSALDKEGPRPALMDKLSAVAFRVQTFRNAMLLGTATGFICRSASSVFLITNYHVLSGYNPLNGQPLHPQGALPSRIKFHVPTMHKTDQGDGFFYREVAYELLDEAGDPLWQVHPRLGHAVDVAALDVGPEKAIRVWTINDACKSEEFDEFPLRPGLDVFVIGFPLGLRVAKHLAIWKRGTIASEPQFDVDDKPIILIDSATRGGMSGSPVVAQIQGVWESKTEAIKIRNCMSELLSEPAANSLEFILADLVRMSSKPS
jgi:S1-C subfamily serine protease